jgi:hypothetical protein
MKNIITLILFTFIMSMNVNFVSAQESQQTQMKILKPKVFAADLIFSYQILNTIELRGSEVDALIEVKNILRPYLEKIQKDNVPLNNPVTFDIPAPIASNLLQFMERGKFTGADAEKYKRFVDGIIEAAKAVENK